MYYIEHKDSDSIELQEPLTESQVINRARNYAHGDELITNMVQAIQTLNKNGYNVFGDNSL